MDSDVDKVLFDFDGINLIAIQALERRTDELKIKTAEIAKLKEVVKDQNAEIQEMKTQLAEFEAFKSRAGAIEAGCVNFIDKALANEDEALRIEYEAGVLGIDTVSQIRFKKSFVDLDGDEQDTVLASLESGIATGWPTGPVGSEQFFSTVRNHTIIGFLADPKHGGNRAYAGWRAIGYPGSRHRSGGYTVEQMRGDADIVTSWGGKLPR